MPAIPWLRRLGFEIWHLPGISRAWRYDFADGSYLLVTDLGGYDLPEPGGPFSAIALTLDDELIDAQPYLLSAAQLFRRFLRMSRLRPT